MRVSPSFHHQTARLTKTTAGRVAVPAGLRRSVRSTPSVRMQAAVAMPAGSEIQSLADEDRAALAKELGYLKIGKPLPDDVSLTDIIKSMPAEASTNPKFLLPSSVSTPMFR